MDKPFVLLRNIGVMKYYSCLLLLALFSCKHKKELMRFVNEGNDGWNAFNISIYNDSTYDKREMESKMGAYTMHGTEIYFKYGPCKDCKLIIDKDSTGCVHDPVLISDDHTTHMRVIFDSLYCGKMN